ncbi:hypothetical protein E8E11_000310 [Didymella keratinophila]|nr:hypothetical protein E8E11_000310 [Didymella keratinophila]
MAFHSPIQHQNVMKTLAPTDDHIKIPSYDEEGLGTSVFKLPTTIIRHLTMPVPESGVDVNPHPFLGNSHMGHGNNPSDGETVWYCSECGHGPASTWNPCCANCGHTFCGGCPVEAI